MIRPTPRKRIRMSNEMPPEDIETIYLSDVVKVEITYDRADGIYHAWVYEYHQSDKDGPHWRGMVASGSYRTRRDVLVRVMRRYEGIRESDLFHPSRFADTGPPPT